MKCSGAFAVLVLAAVISSCGAGGGAPGTPTTPPPPSAAASIVASGPIGIGLCTGPSGGCFYTQEYVNAGAGCANSVRGKVRVYEDETLLASDDWFLDTTVIVRPDERLVVEDCCFDQDAVQRRTRTVSETFWNNVSCD
jgi:hypothetical protein